jgi:hypothetical protein
VVAGLSSRRMESGRPGGGSARRGEADLAAVRAKGGGWYGGAESPCILAHTYANDSSSLRHNAIALLAG